jgi:hypothetical protein
MNCLQEEGKKMERELKNALLLIVGLGLLMSPKLFLLLMGWMVYGIFY